MLHSRPVAALALAPGPQNDVAARRRTHFQRERVVNGRPVNPGERTHVCYGRNRLGHRDEVQCADAAVTATDTTGSRWILMIERRDAGGWALLGGHIEPGETAADATARELTPRKPGWSSPSRTCRSR
ncbi:MULTISPECIES: NUDIX domain-containing protein [unclassified Micromonospora]|uniref:NUDIX domain-containing protein n=1 Tax=unclassified Micromonospora TaxID=2617518 RepID=UPI00364395DD